MGKVVVKRYDLFPYVSIFDPFAASNVYEDNVCFCLGSGRISLICALVSIKNKYQLFLSPV